MDKLPKIGEYASGWERVSFLQVDVSQACRTPWGYGVAYWRGDCFKVVCYPIPINWIVWAMMNIYWKLQNPPQTYLDAYQRGWNAAIDFREAEDKKLQSFVVNQMKVSEKKLIDEAYKWMTK